MKLNCYSEIPRNEKIIFTEKFINSLPIEDTKRMKQCCRLIKSITNNGIYELYNGSLQSLKYKSINKTLYKFRVNKKNRIIYTYGSCLKNIPEEFKESLVFLFYVNDHDKQNLFAKKISYNNDKLELSLSQKDNDKDQKVIKETLIEDFDSILKYTISKKMLNKKDKIFKYLTKYNLDPILSNNQRKTFTNNSMHMPMLLMGCAGSGKTLIGIESLVLYTKKYCNESVNYAYFSLSNSLVNNAKKKFNNKLRNLEENFQIKLNENKFNVNASFISFFNINEYCLEQRGIKNVTIIKNYYDFEFLFFDKELSNKDKDKLKKLGLTSANVYEEIRGIIKGFLDSNYSWNKRINQDNLFMDIKECNCLNEISNIIKELKKFKILKYFNNESKKCFNKENLEKQKYLVLDLEKLQEIYDPNDNIYKFLVKEFLQFDYERKELSKDEYLNITNKYSVLTQEERKFVYKIYEKYKLWIEELDDLGNRIRYDDNDLAYEVIKYTKHAKYDYLIIDEIQDFTEKQIYCLRKLVKGTIEKGDNILFMGDVHQNIMMSSFNYGRLRMSYNLNKLNIKVLHENYRSQKYITKLSNDIAKLRALKVLSKDLKTEMEQKSLCDGIIPFKINFKEYELKKFVNKIAKMTSAMIILSNEEEKKIFMKHFNITEESNINIFTIYEAKGLESTHVFCYNILNNNKSQWHDICTGLAKKQPKYLMPFNLFYVAITRARQYLYVYEKENIDIYNDISKDFQEIFEYNQEILFLNNEESDKLKVNRAIELENSNEFKKAANIYRILKKIDDENRCLSMFSAQFEDYNNALRYLVAIKSNNKRIETIKKLIKLCNDEKALIVLEFLNCKNSFDEIFKRYGKERVIRIIKDFAYKNECENLFAEYFFNVANNLILESCKIIENIIN